MTTKLSTYILLIVVALCSLANATKNKLQYASIPYNTERIIKRKLSLTSTKNPFTNFPSTKSPKTISYNGKGGKGSSKGHKSKGKGKKGNEKSTKSPDKKGKGKGSTKSPGGKRKSKKGMKGASQRDEDTIGSANQSDGRMIHLAFSCLFFTIMVTFGPCF